MSSCYGKTVKGRWMLSSYCDIEGRHSIHHHCIVFGRIHAWN